MLLAGYICSVIVHLDNEKTYGAAKLELWSLLSSTVDRSVQSVSPLGLLSSKEQAKHSLEVRRIPEAFWAFWMVIRLLTF